MTAYRHWRVVALTAALVLAGCSGGGDSSGQASLSVSLMDAPVDGVTAVHVHITGISLKPESGPAIDLTLANGPRTVNLLELTDTNAALLVDDAPIEAGRYEWLAMDVSAEHDNVMDSYVMTVTGGQEELRVPSGRVRLVSGFDIPENQSTQFLFDWDMRTGLVDPPGLPGYLLKPAFRMLEVTAFGVLTGTVANETITLAANACNADDANLDLGNVVYIFAGSNVTPDDIDGTDDPIATADVVPADGVYSYRVVLSPGDYTVAFTCQAADDEPETDETVVFLPAVNVTITGAAQTQNF
ncbi:MAG TPA: DUF4382 domain-containing protein [Gammaproteobacteria bacterium]|nr:DUF4382 domain-containing protein [Gammaproteobacteria bacterium]